ncbi:hypothetical protein DYB25_002215 [Aphanomyces astaci]|uniref:DUF985 domain-containing protein n=1 Tax=Aphanomyces astaci TaxID=112090 RepID=A0A397B3R1_APHAT|nr:hypothetical protein DYB36_008249 [Aphanomyces astaci]RHY14806.1 hypothetical protein DYB25_002215 [Aphanomyces astaci]RHY36195.1 hypothetical protein DYB38_005527 [Aphanomyces astaci]RHY48547.1 hypothetical protein DYB30_004062 [Aphanomyces astaci]RHY63380.1 hypothetical protein DYB34_003743 [Aphanomyces astaci]
MVTDQPRALPGVFRVTENAVSESLSAQLYASAVDVRVWGVYVLTSEIFDKHLEAFPDSKEDHARHTLALHAIREFLVDSQALPSQDWDNTHGVVVWVITSDVDDVVAYHIDYAEMFRSVHDHLVPYTHRQGVLIDGNMPHGSTPVTRLPPGVRRVVVGLNMFNHEIGPFAQAYPEHSAKFNKYVKVAQAAAKTRQPELSVSTIRANPKQAAFLVYLLRKAKEKNLIHNNQFVGRVNFIASFLGQCKFCLGEAIAYILVDPSTDELMNVVLGPHLHEGQVLQFTCPAGWWKAATLPVDATSGFGLLSEAVGPAFDYADNFLLQEEDIALSKHASIVRPYLRPPGWVRPTPREPQANYGGGTD